PPAALSVHALFDHAPAPTLTQRPNSGGEFESCVKNSPAAEPVPPAFVATRRKKYLDDGSSPPTVADTDNELVPEPGEGVHGAVETDAVDMPYSNLHSLTWPPFGLTVAFSVAPVFVTAVAASVVTVGALPIDWNEISTTGSLLAVASASVAPAGTSEEPPPP